MKIVLSRKGFDSSSGGVPNPLFEDGSMFPLPIPDEDSALTYEQISWRGRSITGIVSALTKGKIGGHHRAHLDPDINVQNLERPKDWMPIFGQVGAAQGHLRNQGVGIGDIFLYFGLFKEVVVDGAITRFKQDAPSKHIIWGWLQVGEVVTVDLSGQKLAWASYHPHFGRNPDPTNTLYIARKEIDLPGAPRCTGAGVFPSNRAALQLTDPASEKAITWRLPGWFFPSGGRQPLTYHADPARWNKRRGCTILKAASRGQEFVFDCDQYPEAAEWVADLLAIHR